MVCHYVDRKQRITLAQGKVKGKLWLIRKKQLNNK
jgi:hypothetical protein